MINKMNRIRTRWSGCFQDRQDTGRMMIGFGQDLNRMIRMLSG
jgi:hypothetical protein